MASKIARNASCPCGSGKKYKHCHGSVDNSAWEAANERPTVMQFAFESISLNREDEDETQPEITVTGVLSEEQKRYPFMMVAEPREKSLAIKHFGWREVPPITDKEAVGRQLLRHLSNCLRPLQVVARHDDKDSSMGLAWSAPQQNEAGAEAHRIILRPGLSKIPGTPWSTLWDRLFFKIKGDPLFSVVGYSSEQVEKSFKQLQQVFDNQWVEQVFKSVLGEESHPTMASEFSHDAAPAWFPAYHLSRIATGVICRDPALNMLVELGLALEQLDDLAGVDSLRQGLAVKPALQHQVCLAADLRRAGFEQVQALDSPEHPLQVIVDDQPYCIQTHEVGWENLAGNVAAVLTPGEAGNPRIVHLVISEGRWYEPDAPLPEELEELDIPTDILAVVIGRRFLDAKGGGLKRNAQKILHNHKSVHLEKVDTAGWEKLFVANYEHYDGPALNVGAFFYLQ